MPPTTPMAPGKPRADETKPRWSWRPPRVGEAGGCIALPCSHPVGGGRQQQPRCCPRLQDVDAPSAVPAETEGDTG